jgi:hypothetical protein
VERPTRFEKKVSVPANESGVGMYLSEGGTQQKKNAFNTFYHETTELTDRQIASRRTVKSNPKVKASTAKMIRKVILASRNDMQ